MKLLNYTAVKNPKLVFRASFDHRGRLEAQGYSDDAWRSMLLLGNLFAIDRWNESQNRKSSAEVYYTLEVTNKIVTVSYFVGQLQK